MIDRLKHSFAALFLVWAVIISGCQSSGVELGPAQFNARGPYEYPIADPFAATIIGTPSPYKATLPSRINRVELKLTVFEDREIPQVLWYERGLKFSLAYQKKKAPLIFNIAGTGAAHNSRFMRIMERAFYAGGFHVISLPSATIPNFIVNASSTGVPGRVHQDTEDLYRVMQLAFAQIEDRIEVTEFYLSGYSLGGLHAVFVAKLDEEQGTFEFKKALAVNPPVSVFSTVRVLDGMLDKNIPGGTANLGPFVERTIEILAESYGEEDSLDLSSDFLYRIYAQKAPPEENLKALIGLAFRYSSNNLIFAADVMSKSGYVVPLSRRLTATSSLTEYFNLGETMRLENYLDHVLFPFYSLREPGLSKQELIREASLKRIEGYIRSSDKLALVTNEDDIILAPGELDYLRALFGTRAQIYPNGGHLGNLENSHFVNFMVTYFQS